MSQKKDIPKKALEDLYISQNLSVRQISEILNASENLLFKKIKEYCLKKDKSLVDLSRAQTNIARYGATNPFGSKIIQEKITKTNLEKYGAINPLQNKDVLLKVQKTNVERYGFITPLQNQDVKDKISKTNLERYGVNNPLLNPEILQKSKKTIYENYGEDGVWCEEIRARRQETNLDRYGVINPVQSETVKNKIAKTNIIKYGVPCVFQSEDVKRKIFETNKVKYGNSSAAYAKMPQIAQDILSDSDKFRDFIQSGCNSVISISEKLGVAISTVNTALHKFQFWDLIDLKANHYEEEVANFLTDIGVKFYKDRQMLDGKEIDFYCPDYKIGIEFNGTYWHSSFKVDKKYHYNKSLEAQKKGIRLIHIYEYEWNNPITNGIIKSMLKIAFGKIKNKIYARECEIRQITNEEARPFNQHNHLQGHRNAQYTLGLYCKDNLVQLMSFSYDKKKQWWEIIRGCPGSNNIVVGGVSKLFSHFVKDKNPQVVFSYCDFNKFDGKGYEAIGMKMIGYTGPDMKWWMTDGSVKNRCPSQHKQLKENSKAQIWGAGSKKYIMHLG